MKFGSKLTVVVIAIVLNANPLARAADNKDNSPEGHGGPPDVFRGEQNGGPPEVFRDERKERPKLEMELKPASVDPDRPARNPATQRITPEALHGLPVTSPIIVRLGDTVAKIAARYGLKEEDVREVNSPKEKYEPGTEISVPANSLSGFPSDKPKTNESDSVLVVVRKGETLSRLASLYGVSVDAILRANGNRLGKTLQPGQEITIPPLSKR